jgi:DNA polymerase III delta prime subunit
MTTNTHIEEKARAQIILNISEVERRINEGANEYLQLLNVLTSIYKQIILSS